jgi:sulfite exporter TauE/SafE
VNESLSLLSAFLVGLLGGVHCIGMCGGIVGALTMGIDRQHEKGLLQMLPYHLAYNSGRISSYVIAGGLMGGLGVMLATLLPVSMTQHLLLLLAGLFMVLLGLYLSGWWMALRRLEQVGGLLWRRIEPLGRRFLPVQTPRQAFLLGLLWGWLPCGLVYSVLIWCVSAGGVIEGALLMLAFALGTLPNLLAMGVVAGKLAQLTRKPLVRQLAGSLILLFGVYNIWLAMP